MIAGKTEPGVLMERQRTQKRRDSTGIFQMVVIGLVLAAALWGGLKLLGSTRSSWESQRQDRKAHAAAIRHAAQNAETRQAEENEQKLRAEIERIEREAIATEQQLWASGKLRCINGQIFRKIPNGWENLSGRRC